MANEEQVHVALPKLYGAPAYARPKRPVINTVERPFDPDSLPIEAEQTDDERTLSQELGDQPWLGQSIAESISQPRARSRPVGRPFHLNGIADRIRGTKDRASGA